MAIVIEPAVLADLPELARIQRESFSTSSPFFLEVYKSALPSDVDQATIQRFRNVLQDPTEALLKATVNGRILGFAYWSLPGHVVQQKKESRPYPAGVQVELADEFHGALAARALELSLIEPFYHLHILVVDPVAFRSGAGSALLQWGSEQAAKAGVPVHLESTEAGLLLYSRRGFVDAAPRIVTGPEGRYQLFPVVLWPVQPV